MSCTLTNDSPKPKPTDCGYGHYLKVIGAELRMIPLTYKDAMMSDAEFLARNIQQNIIEIQRKHCK